MTSLFIAQLLGIYFLIFGGLILIRRSAIMPVISDLTGNKALLFAIATLELVAGIALVLAYPTVSLSWAGIISLVGWILLVEGLVYLALPYRSVQKFVKMFQTENWYLVGGILSVGLGAYLAMVGFGILT